MKKLELVYIGKPTSRFEYGELYKAISFNEVGIITFLDKDGVPCEFFKDTLHLHFITLVEFRDKKINEILK
jgi:hypothetical protein